MSLWRVAGGAFLFTGVLELLFLGLSLLGTLLGGILSVAALAGTLQRLEGLLGPVLLAFYGVWLLRTLAAAPIHVAAGVMMLRGRGTATLVWAATAASILPLFTVYCAPTSMVAGILGLIAVLQREGDASAPEA